MSDRARTEIMKLLTGEARPTLGSDAQPGALSAAALDARLAPLLAEFELSAPRTELVRALLLLWHGHLEASHAISQRSTHADGCFLHAIMHRREPDYGNAKYWWRQVGAHPAFATIAARVGEFLEQREEQELKQRLLPGGHWDANTFVDLCETAAQSQAQEDLLREIQRIESESLLQYLLQEGRPR